MPTKRNQDLLDLRQSSDKKASKPLMEKRRRARINHSLAQLKALVIDPNTTERSRQTKLEKADILELTVRHLHEIKRQQRTVHLLEARHPKKKFEIGYAECAREVELFLSNLIDPQHPGLDGELQRRLKDHLSKRLDDFISIEPIVDSSKKESTDEELSRDELLPSSSPSIESCKDDLSLPMETEGANSSEFSPLKKMLHYYSDNMNPKKNKVQDISLDDNFSPKRIKKCLSSANGENHRTIEQSCQSVTSTTGSKSSESSTELKRSENYLGDDLIKVHVVKVCDASHSEASDSSHTICAQPETSVLKMRSHLSTSRTTENAISDYTEYIPSTIPERENKYGQPRSTRNPRFIEQIPLVPRQLANGDWALVLPASLVPSESEDSYPISAFRLVLPTNSTSSDSDCEQSKRWHSSSSPLSSTVSDMSIEEYCSRSEHDSSERLEHNSPDSTQIVWRPW